jgi:hypothetical protein
MPRVNIWIRNEDLENWNSIDDKPAWLHFNLHKGVKVVEKNADGSGRILDVTEKPIHVDATSPQVRSIPQPIQKDSKDYSLCKHGQVKGFCKSGCK